MRGRTPAQAAPRKALAKAWGAVAEVVKPGANPPGSAQSPAPNSPAPTPQKGAKKRAHGGCVQVHPPRTREKTQKGRCMFLTHTAPRMFAIHSCNADRLQNTARHILPGPLSHRGLCPRPAPAPCFTGREKCCIMSLQGAALSRGV